jgi:Mn2+/Fe2+ NRAMP family transporter
MKRLFGLALGVMTAIGGFVDVGNLVTSGVAGARFGYSLTWALAFGTFAMALFGEMAARVTAVAGRPIFHSVRERMGVRAALINLVASLFLVLLTLTAELGGMGLTLQLATSVNYLLWVPVVAAAIWLCVWRVPFKAIDRTLGLLGLSLVVFGVAYFRLHPHWHSVGAHILNPTVPSGEAHPTWWFYAVSLVGAAVTPYQMIFFSSGGLEEGWTEKDLLDARANALIGFPLGGLLSFAVLAAAVPVLQPAGISVSHLGQVALPVTVAIGKAGLLLALLGFLAATFAAGVEAALCIGYLVAQFSGWSWGKMVSPTRAPRFHTVCLIAVILAGAIVLTTIDPVKLTIASVVFGVIAIPFTFGPVFILANDRDYMGRHVNKHWVNALATPTFAALVVIAVVALPLTIITKMGQ